jgi:hypothetical protein
MWWYTFWIGIGEVTGMEIVGGFEVVVESVLEVGATRDVSLDWLWYHIGF